MEETGVPGENHRPVASHLQTLSHNVVSRTLVWIAKHDKDPNTLCNSIGYNYQKCKQAIGGYNGSAGKKRTVGNIRFNLW